MKEKRDKGHLDNKYRILQEDCSNRSERSVNESHSTDRTLFTRDWIQNHSIEVQPPTPINEGNKESWQDMENRFYRRLNEITFDKTSPLYQQVRSTSTTQRTDKQCSAGQKATSMPTERDPIQSSTTISKATVKDGGYIRKTIPCPEHDARRFMFQDRGISGRDGYTGVPCSNSTFAIPPRYNDYMSKTSRSDQNLKPMSPVPESHLTLEWDNFLGTKDDRDEELSLNRQYSNGHSHRKVEFEDYGDSIQDQSSFQSVEGHPRTKINRNATTYENFSGTESDARKNSRERDIVYEEETFDRRTTTDPIDRRAALKKSKDANHNHLNDLSI